MQTDKDTLIEPGNTKRTKPSRKDQANSAPLIPVSDRDTLIEPSNYLGSKPLTSTQENQPGDGRNSTTPRHQNEENPFLVSPEEIEKNKALVPYSIEKVDLDQSIEDYLKENQANSTPRIPVSDRDTLIEPGNYRGNNQTEEKEQVRFNLHTPVGDRDTLIEPRITPKKEQKGFILHDPSKPSIDESIDEYLQKSKALVPYEKENKEITTTDKKDEKEGYNFQSFVDEYYNELIEAEKNKKEPLENNVEKTEVDQNIKNTSIKESSNEENPFEGIGDNPFDDRPFKKLGKYFLYSLLTGQRLDPDVWTKHVNKNDKRSPYYKILNRKEESASKRDKSKIGEIIVDSLNPTTERKENKEPKLTNDDKGVAPTSTEKKPPEEDEKGKIVDKSDRAQAIRDYFKKNSPEQKGVKVTSDVNKAPSLDNSKKAQLLEYLRNNPPEEEFDDTLEPHEKEVDTVKSVAQSDRTQATNNNVKEDSEKASKKGEAEIVPELKGTPSLDEDRKAQLREYLKENSVEESQVDTLDPSEKIELATEENPEGDRKLQEEGKDSTISTSNADVLDEDKRAALLKYLQDTPPEEEPEDTLEPPEKEESEPKNVSQSDPETSEPQKEGGAVEVVLTPLEKRAIEKERKIEFEKVRKEKEQAIQDYLKNLKKRRRKSAPKKEKELFNQSLEEKKVEEPATKKATPKKELLDSLREVSEADEG